MAFTTLYAAEALEICDHNEQAAIKLAKDRQAFLSVLRESVFWQIDGRAHDEELDAFAENINDNIN